MHFKNSVKSTNLILLKAVKEVKSTMSTGKQFHTSITRFTKNAATTFVLLLLYRNDYMNRQTFRNRLVRPSFLRSFLNLTGVVNPRGPLIGGLNTRLDLLDLA